MTHLKPLDKEKLELAFNMKTGLVLYFSDKSFHDFILSETDIDINEEKYFKRGSSKANRLRTFWELVDEKTIGKLSQTMLELWKFEKSKYGKDFDEYEQKLFDGAKSVADRLAGSKSQSSANEDISHKFTIDFVTNPEIRSVLFQRVNEIERCMNSKAYLAVIILSGSVLEGMLHSVAENNIANFNRAKSAPKKKDGSGNKLLRDWTLQDLINTANEIGFLREDFKKFGHALRDFRNYIHPREQIQSQFHPDETTARMALLTLESAIFSLSKIQ